VAEVRRRGWRRVGIVDFRPPALSIYAGRLERAGVAWEGLPEEMLGAMEEVMLAVSEGRSGPVEELQVRAAVEALRARGVDGVVLACTEFPLALSGALGDDIVNPAEPLAEAAVRAALG
jgi:aspartate/glutamate racemase